MLVPNDEENKHTMKNARSKLEIPMPAAMPCKTSLCRSSRETCRTIGGHKTKYACVVEGDESMRFRMEGARLRYHEGHIVGKGMNSLSRYNPVHKFIPMLQAMRNSRCKGKNWRKYRHDSRQKSETTMR